MFLSEEAFSFVMPLDESPRELELLLPEEADFLSPGELFCCVGAFVRSWYKVVSFMAGSAPWTESMISWSFFREWSTFFIFRDGHRVMPCCLHILFRVVGQTVKKKDEKMSRVLEISYNWIMDTKLV